MLAAVPVLAPGLAPVRADVRPLTLYERTGRAPLVIWGEVADGEHRFAEIRTLQIVKCDIPERPPATFRIAFRLDSFLRRPWEGPITFKDGERVVLFLRKFTKEDGEQPEGDLYTLMWGAQGKFLLPPEGEQAYVDAVRAFEAVLTVDDPDRQAVMLRGLLEHRNPYISDTSFEEMIRQGLGDPDLVPDLFGYFAAQREPTRVLAMRLMRQILEDARAAGREIPAPQGIVDMADALRGRAVADTSEGFRVETVRTLAVLGGDDTKAFLTRLAREDPSQHVRYEAEKTLLGWARTQ